MFQSLGFGYVWLVQGVARENCVLRMFKQRLTDVFWQDWMAGINSIDRFTQYRKFKSVLEPDKYLDSIRQKCFRDALIRFRLGISDINVHKNRHKASDLPIGNDVLSVQQYKRTSAICASNVLYVMISDPV